jgi:3-oxoacyl-[acyl-carrier protein] reductase
MPNTGIKKEGGFLSMAMELQLEGRTALITGASQGIGRGTAKCLAAEGVKCAVAARRGELLEELADEIEKDGGPRPETIVTPDLTKRGGTAPIAEEAIKKLGHVDILVNSAGRSKNPDYPGNMPFDAPEEIWDGEMQLNYGSIRSLTLALMPQMIDQNFGRVINITGKTEPRDMRTANPTKAACHAWAKGLSRQVAKHNVTINSIPPGKIVSEQILRNYSPEARKNTSKWINSGDFGVAEDIGHLIVFLSSPLARYITGTVIPVDSGFRRYAY